MAQARAIKSGPHECKTTSKVLATRLMGIFHQTQLDSEGQMSQVLREAISMPLILLVDLPIRQLTPISDQDEKCLLN